MAIVVTGATGYIGGRFVSRARAEGRAVFKLARAGAVAETSDVLAHDGGVDDLAHVLRSVGADTVVLCAAAFSPADDPDDTDALLAANIDLPMRLLQASRKAEVSHWLNIGSLWEHDDTGARRPINLYAAMKTAFEDMLAYMAGAHDLAAITLKLSDTYGPDDQRKKLIPMMKACIERGETLHMTSGTQRVCYCHVDDVTAAMMKACDMLPTRRGTHAMFVVEGDEALSIRDLTTRLQSRLDGALSVRLGSVPIDGKKPHSPWVGGPRLPGWRPEIELMDGLASVLVSPA